MLYKNSADALAQAMSHLGLFRLISPSHGMRFA